MYFQANNASVFAYTASRDIIPSQSTVVFIHGSANDHSCWAFQSRYFAYHGYNTLALDLPGHGLSKGQALPSIEAIATWLAEVLEPYLAAGVHLVGHSMGALVALQSAAQIDSLRSLSLLGFCNPMPVHPNLLDAAQNNPQQAHEMITHWSLTSSIGGEPNPGFWVPGLMMKMMENSQKDALYIDLNACNEYKNGVNAMQQITTPTLFLSGQKDRMTPIKALSEYAKSMTDARVQLLPYCGHGLMSEAPEQTLDALSVFIASQGA